ncbi:MAG: choice-of-anchor L domain-containing protein, partial [Bacteroidales bacterium]|nr:choice-of-anchor L domain-containing protein [Bacteroidales bacterium]
ALVPGTTTPVSINNINNGNNYPTTGPCTNCAYYVDNYNGMTFEYDGYTTVLTAMALVVPCETYHIKLAVADAVDHILDSGVLLEAGSFSSGGNINASHHSSFGSNPNVVYEGCDNYWIFSRVDSTTLADSMFVNIVVTGTADTINDVSGIPSDFWILPGEMADTFYYDALMDNLTEGQEYLVVSVINGCPCSTTFSNDTVWILDNFDLNPTITPDDHICIGNNFTINVAVNPSLDPGLYSYQWSIGDTVASITVSPTVTTTYDVTITHGCFSDTTLSCTITVIPDIGMNFTASQDTICINGSIDFTYTDTAAASATYLWTFPSGNPASDNTQGPVSVQWSMAGTYNMTLHVDDMGCTGDTSMTVTVLPQPTVSLSETDVLCNGGNDGSITATPGTGIQPFTYLWNDPTAQTTATASNLTAGTYTVSFADVFGCQNTESTIVSEPTPMAISVQTMDILCFGAADGQVSTTAQGGIPPYSYLWNSGQTTANITGLSSGNYTVTITDSNGCIVIGSAILNEPQQALQLSLSTVDASCNGFSDGNITSTTIGGTAPYSYNWDNGQTTANNQNITAGTYCVTVTDAHNCTINNCVSISEPTALTYTTATIPATCNGYNDGSASVSVAGGSPPYSYIWSSGTSGNSAVSLYAGNYTVTVTDNHGCTFVSTMTVTEPDILVVTLPNDYQICDGTETTINASGTGGTFPYLFQWNTGNNTQNISISPHQSTTYIVTITDSHNCVNNSSITIDIFPDLYINAFANADSVCPGDPIVIMANYGGGTGGPYYFYVDGVLSNFPAVEYPNDNHTYLVEIKDDCDYVASDNVSVGLFPVPAISFSSDITEGCPPLLVHFNEFTACDSCSYTWNFGDNDQANLSFAHSPTHIYHETGVYDVSLSVVSSNGCNNISTFPQMITVYQAPYAQFSTIPSVISILTPNVQFWNLTTQGENYYWSFGDGDSSLESSPYHLYLDTGNYQVVLVAESDLGCLDTALKTITIQPEMTFWAPTAFSPDGDGINDIFYVYGYGIDTTTFHLTIFDRWGESIFETDNILHGWNGAANDNKPANLGIYAWYISYRTTTGVAREQSGIINLIK